MHKWQRKRYPAEWEALAKACKEWAGWKCEHCGVAQFEVIESRTGQPYMVYLHAAHADPELRKDAQAPHLLALCVRCHARYDYAIRQRQARVALERLKHQKLLARWDVDHRFMGG
jgi:hypothetical protein